jgi:hypothetical protein
MPIQTDRGVTSSWITRIAARGFRGITSETSLEIGSGHRPASLILLGDNGSGKSSLVDALQFAVQGRIRDVDDSPTIAAQAARGPASAAWVSLSSGEEVKRTLGDAPLGRQPHPSFEKTPLVLRRSDILRFWDTPASERQLVFLGYLRDDETRAIPGSDLHRQRLREQLRLAEGRLVQTLRRLEGEPGAQGLKPWLAAREGTATDAAASRAVKAAQDALTRRDRAAGDLAALERTLSGSAGPRLLDALENAGEWVTAALRRISPMAPVDQVIVAMGKTGELSLDLEVVLTSGQRADPAHVLSEANRDLLALLMFTAIAQTSAAVLDQSRVMVLDDVFQSVDAPIRVAAIDHLLTTMGGWQFIVTVHDRLWREQVLSQFRRHGIQVRSYEIIRWTDADGPRLRLSDGSATERLERALQTGDPVAIAGHAGQHLEEVCGILSWTLPTSVRRRRNDQYTIGDLWPGVYKQLKRTNVQAIAEEVDRYLHLRNLLGAHYNEWAQGASVAEAERFANAVGDLVRSVKCDSCGGLIEATNSKDRWVCRCGATSIGPPVA